MRIISRTLLMKLFISSHDSYLPQYATADCYMYNYRYLVENIIEFFLIEQLVYNSAALNYLHFVIFYRFHLAIQLPIFLFRFQLPANSTATSCETHVIVFVLAVWLWIVVFGKTCNHVRDNGIEIYFFFRLGT